MSAPALIVSTLGQRRADALATRSATAAERMAVALARRKIQAERHGLMPKAALTLAHFQGDAYLLNTAGRATAYEVRLERGDLSSATPPRARRSLRRRRGVRGVQGPRYGDGMVTAWLERPDGAHRAKWSQLLPLKPQQ